MRLTLSELRSDVREYLDDTISPYLYADIRIRYWLNEAIKEACLRARLLRESDHPTICRISLTEGTATYAYDPAVMVIQRAALIGEDAPILSLTRDWELDRIYPRWETETGRPIAVAVDMKSRQLTFAPTPDADYTVGLQLWRVPTTDEELLNDTDEPVIPEHYHSDLHHWVLYRARSARDLETYLPEEAADHLAQFTHRFGERPSADHLERWQFERPISARAHFM